jgi:hypothetical protein
LGDEDSPVIESLDQEPKMGIRTATHTAHADPAHVLAVLTDPQACGRWAPIEFRADHPRGRRLRAGTETVLHGAIAGQPVSFEVTIERADDRGLRLRARGPLEMRVAYSLTRRGCGTTIEASIELQRGRGLTGALLARAADAVLAGGALSFALRRIAQEAEQRVGRRQYEPASASAGESRQAAA